MNMPLEVVRRGLKNIVKLYLLKNKNLDPLIYHFYITNKCNLDCSYCDDGTGTKYNNQKITPLNTEDTKKLLKIMRKKCSWISVTGGEPFMRPDIIELLRYMKKELKFDMITFNTNGFLLDKKEETLDYIDHLMISLDTMDMEKFATIINRPLAVADKIKENIIVYAKLQKEKKYSFTVNSVILPEGIQASREVMHFCFEHNINFSPMPCILGKVPHPKLINNEEYQNFVKEIIQHKKNGKKVVNTFKSLKNIINFDRFDCYPTLILDIYSDGTMYYPCSPLNLKAGNLLKIGDVDKALKIGIEKHGKIKKCQYSCNLSCYMEPSLMIKHPSLILKEAKKF